MGTYWLAVGMLLVGLFGIQGWQDRRTGVQGSVNLGLILMAVGLAPLSYFVSLWSVPLILGLFALASEWDRSHPKE